MNQRIDPTTLLVADIAVSDDDTGVATHEQAVAASNTDHVFIAPAAGTITEVVVKPNTGAAAGESMTFDLRKNGATILTGVATIDNGTGTTAVTATIDPTKEAFVADDVFTVVRAYAPGGGAAPIDYTFIKVIFNLG